MGLDAIKFNSQFFSSMVPFHAMNTFYSNRIHLRVHENMLICPLISAQVGPRLDPSLQEAQRDHQLARGPR